MNKNESERVMPTYFISHGGGPWYWMDEQKPLYENLEKSLRAMSGEIGATPKAILVVSGHWEEKDFAVMTSPQPSMVYDYLGFPEHAYRVQYNAPGSPEVAARVLELLKGAGFVLFFHPDFLRGYSLGKKIKEYGFFSYALNEALHLSEKEEKMVETIMKNIEQEYRSGIDKFSQDVMTLHIELLLNYSNRFYDRQFITRKNANNDLLTRLEELLNDYFSGEKVAAKLNVSPNYLSDMLRSLTGQSTQQHIHDKLIEKAKEILTATSSPIGEIAGKLGFETAQSFSKLFKNKTDLSPLEYRNSFIN